MRVMVILKATKSSEAGELPSEELLTAMGDFNEELVRAGIMKAGEGLKPSSAAKRVLFRGSDRTVTDGPFAETKELIAGFWLWEVDSIQEAIDWVKRCPNPMPEDSEIEVRPVYEIEDLSPSDPDGNIREQEESLMQSMALQQATVQPYLFFGGCCEEALAFYEQAVGATVTMKMKFSESPDPVPDGKLQSGFEEKIMHASFTVGKMNLMASDGCDERSNFDGFRLALTLPTETAAHSAYDALAEGGSREMPLTKTFWSPCYGMVTDRFGLGWMVMVLGDDC
ncbi:YciI family protein [Roseiconus lacunae]|uniref:YciI family protein n=1 Tax=Roseiconus lacunae TaxID=2605694 RepID=UPI0011F3E2C2|nr:YciI family protein [Roseiconus lacunae]